MATLAELLHPDIRQYLESVKAQLPEGKLPDSSQAGLTVAPQSTAAAVPPSPAPGLPDTSKDVLEVSPPEEPSTGEGAELSPEDETEGVDMGGGGKAVALPGNAGAPTAGPTPASVADSDSPSPAAGSPAPGTPSAVNPMIAEYLSGKANKDMAKAQEAAGSNRLMAGLAESAGQLGHAISRAPDKFDPTAYKFLKDNANAPVTDLETAQKYQAETGTALKGKAALQEWVDDRDPTSPKSTLWRKFAADSGITVTPQDSAASLEKILPFATKEKIAKAMADANLNKRQELADAKTDTMWKQASEQLAQKRASGAANQAAKSKLFAANRLEGLLDQYSDGNLPKIPTRELATGIAAMLGSGAGAQTAVSAINEIEPHSGVGNINDAISWLTNKPQGRGQAEFIKQYANTIMREKAITTNQLKLEVLKEAAGLSETRLFKDPERFERALLKPNYGLTLADVEHMKRGDEMDLKNGQWYAPGKMPKSATANLAEQVRGGGKTPAPAAPDQSMQPTPAGEIKRIDPNTGRTVIYDAATKKFLRYE